MGRNALSELIDCGNSRPAGTLPVRQQACVPGTRPLRRARALILLLTCLTTTPCSALPDRAEMLSKTASIVRVQAFDPNDRTYFGTGVTVAPQRVATNCHVTRQAVQIVVIHRGETLRVAGQVHDIDHDVCVLDVPLLRAPPLTQVRSASLRIGQPVWAMSFEGGAGVLFRIGIVRGLHAHDGAHVIESTTAFTSGASGGALMTEAGELAGLMTYRLRGDRRSYFSVPLDWLPAGHDVETLPAVVSLPAGVAFWQRSEEILPEFLRAHRHMADGNWQALLGLTRQWLARDQHSAEAWWLQGAALERSEGAVPAARAYRHALGIDPRFLPALMGLGRLSATLGDTDEARRIIATLRRIGGALSTCLDRIDTEPDTSPPSNAHEDCNDF